MAAANVIEVRTSMALRSAWGVVYRFLIFTFAWFYNGWSRLISIPPVQDVTVSVFRAYDMRFGGGSLLRHLRFSWSRDFLG